MTQRENPFPGMNPWLESHWGDVHTRLTTYACDQLQPHLSPGLRARIEEYVAVEIDGDAEGPRTRFAPDVRIIERPGAAAEWGGGAATAVAEIAEPVMIPRQSEPETLHYIEIVDSQAGHRIVTTIEFLSLADKATEDGREQYRSKQRNMLAGQVNLVEIDLPRAGKWVLAAPKAYVPKRCREPYRISVVRAARQDVAEVPERTWVVTGRERHVAAAREGNLPYPHRALRTPEFLYIRNFAPDRWPMGGPGAVTDIEAPPANVLEQNTFAAFADMDASPTKAWLIGQRREAQWQWHYDYAFAKRPAEELYDLRRDPDQTKNLAADPAHAEVKQQLASRLVKILSEAGDPRVTGDGGTFDRPPYSSLEPTKTKTPKPKKTAPAT